MELFQTERLRVVLFSIKDYDLLFQVTGNPMVMKYFPNTLNYEETIVMLQKIVTQYESYGYSFWKLTDKLDGGFIGMAGLLHQAVEGKDETEIAYRILPQYWRKGYAYEAVKGCIKYGNENLGRQRLISLIRPENIPSRGVAQKLGAKIEKTVMHVGYKHDVWVY